MSVILSHECIFYLDPLADWNVPDWREVGIVKDVTLESVKPMQRIPLRPTNGFAYNRGRVKEVTISVSFLHNNDDTDWAYLTDSYYNNRMIHAQILDGPMTAVDRDTVGLRAIFEISRLGEQQILADAVQNDLTLVFGDSLYTPEWLRYQPPP